jgi:hypothetical protein
MSSFDAWLIEVYIRCFWYFFTGSISAGLRTMFTPFMGKLICLLYICLSMGLLKNIRMLVWGDLERARRISLNEDPWNLEAENPTPREDEAEWLKTPVSDDEWMKIPEPVKRVPAVKPPVAVDADPWGSVKKPQGALNPLKLAVTVFILVDVCAALFFVSSNLTITATALLLFLPNATFLLLLRGKL